MHANLTTVAGAALCALLMALGAGRNANAQTYPARPITLIVPGSPGASTDILGRMLSRILEQRLKQPIIVENRVAAGGYVGADTVARAEPDGYTLLFTSDTTLHSYLFIKEHRVLWKELTVIAGVATTPMVMLVSNNLKSANLREFIAAAKAAPGKFNYAYPSNSTMQLELIGMLDGNGLELTGIPYAASGFPQAVAAGDVQLALVSAIAAKPLVDGSKAVAVAATAATRTAILPGVLTAREQGFDMDFTLWTGLFGPSRLPRAIKDRLAKEINEGLAQPEAREQISKVGGGPMSASAEQLEKNIADTSRRYVELARKARITPQ